MHRSMLVISLVSTFIYACVHAIQALRRHNLIRTLFAAPVISHRAPRPLYCGREVIMSLVLQNDVQRVDDTGDESDEGGKMSALSQAARN